MTKIEQDVIDEVLEIAYSAIANDRNCDAAVIVRKLQGHINDNDLEEAYSTIVDVLAARAEQVKNDLIREGVL